MAKGEFHWDTEEALGTVTESDKVQWDVKHCTLNNVSYIAATKRVLKKDGWAIAKNQVFKKSVFDHIGKLVEQLDN